MYALDPDIWHKWDEDVAEIPRFGSLSSLHASHDVQVVQDAASVLSKCKISFRVDEVLDIMVFNIPQTYHSI